MTELANEAWGKLEHLPEIVHAIRQAFTDGLVTRDHFAQGIPAIIPSGLLEGRTPSELRHVELCILYEATRRQRAEMAFRLDPYGLEVRGDPEWRYLVRNAGGTVAYHNDLAAYYRTTAINLNSTSIQMKTAVNQRVFDCPAAGGFLITDDQADLAELFDLDSEVVIYATLDELEDKVAYYLKHPKQRIPIVQRAQQRITGHHTHAHRLQALEAYLRQRYA
jgi:spore maturation protein CgeB